MEVTSEHQQWLEIGTTRIKALFLPKGGKKPWPKPSAGDKSKPTYKKAECNPSLSSKLFFWKTLIRKSGKNHKGSGI